MIQAFSPRRFRRGNILFLLVLVLMGLGVASAAAYAIHLFWLKQVHGEAWRANAQLAAESAVRIMLERLIGKVELRLGEIDVADLAALQADLAILPLPPGAELDSVSGYYVVAVESGTIVPHDEKALVVTSDVPRTALSFQPIEGGVRADRTVTIAILATVQYRGARASAKATIAVSRILPYQYAVYTDDDLEICVDLGHDLIISGSVRAEGVVDSRCGGDRTYVGNIYAQQQIDVSSEGAHTIALDGGRLSWLESITRDAFESNPEWHLARWEGRVRLGAAIADRLIPSGFQTIDGAGRGECPDGEGMCGGQGFFSPGVQIQRTIGPSTNPTYTLNCGWAYEGESCAAVGKAITYVPYPFGDMSRPDSARPHPDDPTRLWHGLFPDYRRESRCTATLGGGIQFRTFRCITNAFGFRLDASQLPPIPGGLLYVKRWAQSPPGMGPFQEVLMIEKAARIAGPLTIVSEIPIVIVGSLNTTESKPVMIDAPLVTVLPAEALQQLQTAAIWDSTATTQHGPLTAYSPVRIHAVIRSNYHLTKNGNYYGGTIEQIPAVLGDFGAVTLEVVGAIEGRKKNTSDWDAYAAWFAPYGAEPGGFWVVQPRSRRIFWDEQLALADRQPRGSWFWPNLPPSQAVGPRTRERQLRASGGYTLIRLVEEVTRIRKLAPIASIVLPIKSVPQAPVADFTVTENVIQGLATFDASVATDPDGSIVSYFWDFGDGSPRAFGSLVAHQYTSAGPYEVTLWVVDNEGLVSKRSETITLSW